MTKIYNYHYATKEYIGESLADHDPLTKDAWLYPAHSTTTPPPSQVPIREAVVFTDGLWSFVPDHRGEIWWVSFNHSTRITELGDPALLGLLSAEPKAPVKTRQEKIQAALGPTETSAQIARTLEDLIATVELGEPVAPRTAAWVADRRAKRAAAKL